MLKGSNVWWWQQSDIKGIERKADGMRQGTAKTTSGVKAALYLRLSRDDGDKAESDSIKSQRALVKDFAQERGYTVVDEFVDDGYTGTNFDRPAFKRMMSEIEKHRINCIIVKDLSRLGRNYIEMGRFMTRVFPSLNVRLISVTDNYDSINDESDVDQIVIPFKNLINDAYCRDISMKIRSQLEIKRKKGQFVGSFAVYGYKKDEKNKNHLVIDEVAAEVVELIFNMKLDGCSSGRIADKLNEVKIAPPLEYKRMCSINYNSGFRSKETAGWSVTSVNRILHNEVYTGTVVQGKTKKVNYKVKRSVALDESDWVRVEGMHDAIIPKDIFLTVQRLLLMDTRTSPKEDSVFVLSGLVKCADCGQNMVRRMTSKKGRKYYYYHCSTYKESGQCGSHIISEMRLQTMALLMIRKNLKLLADAKRILSEIDSLPDEAIGIRLIEDQIKTQVKEIEKYKDLIAKLYQDMSEGIVSREEYKEINANFVRKIDELKASVQANEKKKEQTRSLSITENGWIDEFLKHQDIESLDRRVAVALIDKIVVYDKERIEVVFRHMDKFMELISIADQLRKGRTE